MVTGDHRSLSVGALHALIASLAIGVGGCVSHVPVPSTSTSTPIPTPMTAASVTIDRAPVATRPAPESAVPESPAPAAVTVAILYSGGVPAQASIAADIGVDLAGPGYSIRLIDIDSLRAATPIDAAFEAEVGIVAAVGPGALVVAQERFANAEIVFAQVLDAAPETQAQRRVRGVAPMPPPALQLAAWSEVDPGLERIGLITSERFAGTVPAARQAAESIGAELVHRLSASDRETFYLFRRLAPSIDGLWLAPDGDILSMGVIEEMLTHAAELDIGVLVFSERLLEHGGLISVGAPLDHVAVTVVDAVETIRAGRAADLPAEIPLAEGDVRVNARAARRLGLPVTPTKWVIRDER